MEKLLTIVIPIYKVEKYIRKCLDSCLVSQEIMDMLEVIAVNDGTPDNSAIIAHEYENKYPQTFRVIDKENGGHGSAWNVGLKEAKGRYIRFLDSDDWLEGLDELMLKLKDCSVDIILTPHVRFYEDLNTSVKVDLGDVDYGVVYDADSFDWKNRMKEIYTTDFWYATYKTSMLQPHYPLFVEHVYYDDAILFVAPLLLAKSFTCIDIPLYHYLLGRLGQTVNRTSQKVHALDYIKVSESMISFVNRFEMIPLGKKQMIEKTINIYCRVCFDYFSVLPYKVYKANVLPWYLRVKSQVPYLQECREMTRMDSLPFPLYWLLYIKFVSTTNWIGGLHTKFNKLLRS